MIMNFIKRYVQRLFSADGQPDALFAFLSINVPLLGAWFCYGMLSPADLAIALSFRELAAQLRWIFLLGLAVNVSILAANLAALIYAGWNQDRARALAAEK